MNAKEIAQRLADDAEGIATYLLPNGKRQGREWKAGSTAGEEGGSLSVCVRGNKAGVWADFGTNEKGDLLDLWMAVRALSLPEAMAEAMEHLGIRDTTPGGAPVPKSYARPAKPKAQKAKGRAFEWLKGRGLADETIEAFKIAEVARGEQVFAVFPYLRDGEYVNAKYRDVDSKKGMRQEKDAEPCLFGWHLIEPRQRVVAIAEGEIDAMTLHQMGVPALSVNAGAGNHQWIENDWQRLERFSEILVAFDSDEAGEVGAVEVMKRLGLDRCKRLVFPSAKDANEYLQAGAERVDFHDAVAAARPMDPEELRQLADFMADVKASFRPLERARRDPRLRFDKDLDWFEFRRGEVTLWTGINGHGKSLLLAQVELGLIAQGERFMVFSGELSPVRQLKRMVKQATGLDRPSDAYCDAVEAWIRDACWVFNFLGSAPMDRLLEVFTHAHRRYGISHFVIDSLMTTDVPDDGPRANTAQKEAMAKLTAFARGFNVHVHLVAHPRKGRDESNAPGKMDVAGSGHLTNGADNIFSVWKAEKDEAQPTDDGEPDARLELKKQRNGDGPTAVQNFRLALWFNKPSMQYRTETRWRPLSYVQFSNHAEAAAVDAGIDLLPPT